MSATRALILIGLLVSSVVSQQVFYSEDFEGPIGMTVTGGGWQFGTPSVVGPTTVPEGDSCAGTIINGSYANSANYQMVTPSIALPDTSVIKLSFFDWLQVESCCDAIRLEVEQNGSGIWNQLLSSSSSTSAWSVRQFDLSTYRNSTIRLRFTLTSDGSVVYPGWYVDDIRIYHPITSMLTVAATTGGTTSPTGSVAIETNTPQSIVATPATGYRFDNWTVTSGSATIASSTSYSTTVSITSNAAIRANFSAGTIYPITSSDATYNYTTHYYTGTTPGNGVAFSFTAPATGSYAIVAGDVQAASKYLYYYGTSSTFSSYLSYQYGSGTIALPISATAGTTYYFKVVPTSLSYYTYDFTIRYTTTPTLTVTNNGNGTTSPTGSVAVASGVAQTITATPAAGYRFDNWTVTSGSATIANAATYSTTVTVTGNATIRANFSQGTIYQVTNSSQTYNYTTHYYAGTSPGSLPGVAFRFTAPSAGGYAIVVEDVESTSKYILDYGTDQTFGTYVTYIGSATGTMTMTFTAASAGEVHYFSVLPNGTYTNRFTLRYDNTSTLTINNDGNGSTTPSGFVAYVPNTPLSISATPNTGYRFNNWTVVSGSAAFSNPNSYTTTVTSSGNATIRANFKTGTIYQITNTETNYDFTTHQYNGTNPGTGVAFRFTAPAAGTYAIVVKDIETSYKYFYDYSTDATFSTSFGSMSGTGTLVYSFTAAAANEQRYFKVVPSGSTYYLNNFSIRWSQQITLTVTNNGNGTTTPTSVSVYEGAGTAISATPSSGYYFLRWEKVSGGTPIFDVADAANTTVAISGSSTTIRGVFAPIAYDTLVITSDGNGFTNPSDTVILFAGRDTTIRAIPGGAYLFTNWTLAGGTAVIASPNNPVTDISGHKATIRANFHVDPNARPDIIISNIDISGHPDICVTASVTDTAGRSIAGLDSSYFTLFEDGASLPFQLSTITDVGGTSVTLVIDKSGSMDGTPITEAIQAAQTYVATMTPLDRCAIVTFEDSPLLRQGMTSNQTLLSSVLSGIPTTGGGGTSILSGANLGVAQLLQETNPRNVIIFSDGNGTGTPSLDSVVNYARHNNVTIHSIGIGAGATYQYPLQNLADSTGGTYTTAPSASDLTLIYAQIKRRISAQYILCYQTPDLVFNGDTHTVVVSVNMNNATSRDTTYWDESNQPPVIILTSATQAMLGVSQPVNTAITISADVTDDGSVSGVRLFFRVSGSGSAYTEIPMTLLSGTTYRAVIPAGSVLSPGIDFYLLANDNYNLIGRSPNVMNPANQPWVIPVGNQAPLIVHAVPPCIPAPVNTTIDAVITDNTLVASATLFFKRPTDALYQSAAMAVISPDNYRAVIPAASITAAGGDYYLQAADNFGVVARLPQTGNFQITLCHNHAPIANAGPDQNVPAGTGCQATVTLDGAGSSDPDGDPITYSWQGPFSGTATGSTPTVTLQAGTHQIILTVDDGHGNSDKDTVQVVVTDISAPEPENDPLPTLYAGCSITLSAPYAVDACVGRVRATTTSPMDINTQGTHNFNWLYDDGRGNSVSQTQTIIIRDTIAPVITSRADTTVIVSALVDEASVTLDSASVSDDCALGALEAIRSDGNTLYSPYAVGTTTVWWKACDAVGNCDSAPQRVMVRHNRVPRIQVVADTTVAEGMTLRVRATADDSDGTAIRLSADFLPPGAAFIDSGNGIGLLSWNIGCSDNGNYHPVFRVSDGIDSTDSGMLLTVTDVNFPPRFDPIGDQTIPENQLFNLTIRSTDCDGSIPRIRAISIPKGASFTDNNDGTATFSWKPKCDENGFYIVIFETMDDATAVRDTIVIRVEDVNCYLPEITLSDDDVTVGLNLPVTVTVKATDGDGTPPLLSAEQLPSGARFDADEDGNGVLRWTPTVTGVFTPRIVAVDQTDPAVRVDTVVTITVLNRNITGPVFLPRPDTTIDENQLLTFSVTARDPDGTVPGLRCLQSPAGATFSDNGSGSGLVTWRSGPAMHGDHPFVFTASDGEFYDTLRVTVTVRDINVAPAINPLSDKNVEYGKSIRFTVSAYDPDEDGTIPELSVSCTLPGHTFDLIGNGSAIFGWTATLSTGSYPVTFYASDGFLTSSASIIISVNKKGSIRIVADPGNTVIYACPTPTYPGWFLDSGSAVYSAAPGAYWFRAEAPGYRPATFTGVVIADSTSEKRVSLKPSIPLMFMPAETLSIRSVTEASQAGSVAFVDLNGDGIQDLSVASDTSLLIYSGMSDGNGLRYSMPAIPIVMPAGLDSIVAHTYADWNNDGRYECVFSMKNGRIIVASVENEIMGTMAILTERTGETLFPFVLDNDNDGRKDLMFLSRGKGLYCCLNDGTDNAPHCARPIAVGDTSTGQATRLKTELFRWDLDANGRQELIGGVAAYLQTMNAGGDSLLGNLPDGADLNGGGRRVGSANASVSLMFIPDRLPCLVTFGNGKAQAFRLRLLGDVTGDGTVDITDISRISKLLEKQEDDDEWNPLYNLKLNDAGNGESIDVRDISRASKSWELQE
jgi:VWFA-related protein